MSPTQWAAPTAIGSRDRLVEALGGALGARPVGGGEQREQFVGLPAHDHVGVAQAVGQHRRELLGGAERDDDPHDGEVAPVADAFGHETVEQQPSDVRSREDEGPAHEPTLSAQP